MSNPNTARARAAVQFAMAPGAMAHGVELIRRQAETTFHYFCWRCNRETLWTLVAEDARHEYYQCRECGLEKGWKVR